jgi:hypothetical protein
VQHVEVEFLVAGRLARFCRQVLDGSGDAFLQVVYRFAILSRVDCVLQEIQGTFENLYNVQRDFVRHD